MKFWFRKGILVQKRCCDTTYFTYCTVVHPVQNVNLNVAGTLFYLWLLKQFCSCGQRWYGYKFLTQGHAVMAEAGV